MKPLPLLATAAALLSGCGEKPAPAPAAPPALPQGRLQMVGSGVTEARFLGLDDLQKGDGAVRATVLLVGATPTSAGGKYAMVVKREVIDCAGARTTDERAAYYDVTGKLVGSDVINTGRMGRPMEASETEAAAACGAAAKGTAATGWKAAQRAYQSPPEGYGKAADRKDFDAQAWLCTATVRGRLNPPDVAACDRAVALKPDDVPIRLDHGYMSLVTNDTAGARADFDRVLAANPDNAPALLGRSLVAALRNQTAAGKPDHDRAVQLDPKVVETVEATYKVSVGAAYR